MSQSLKVLDEETNQKLRHSFVLSSCCPINLLGRDLRVKLRFYQRETIWSKCIADGGLIKHIIPVGITPKSSFRPNQRQYPLKPEAEKVIEPIVKDLKQAS